MASPLVFTYNVPGTSELDNQFVNAPTSPLPGLSTAFVTDLQSPNLVLQGVTLTFQFYGNNVTPATGAATSLRVDNITTIIASSATNTLGTLSYVLQYQNPVSTTFPTGTKLAKTSSLVNAASGIFANYLFGNVITVYDNTTYSRTIYIYSAQ